MFVLMLLVATLVVTFLILVAHLRRLPTDIPGPWSPPLVGNAYMVRTPNIFFQNICKLQTEYGTNYRMYLGNKLMVLAYDPEDIEKIFCSSRLIERDPLYNKFAGNLLGKGLLTSDGETWKRTRKLVENTFHYQVLNGFLTIFNKRAAGFAETLQNFSGQDIDIYKHVSVCTLEMIFETALGGSIESEAKEEKIEIISTLIRLIRLLEERMARPWLAFEWLHNLSPRGREAKKLTKVLRNFLERAVNRNFIEAQKNGEKDKSKKCFIHTVIGQNGVLLMEKNEIIDEALSLMAAGFETTAKSLCFTLCLLAHHKDWQAAVHQELDDIFLRGGEYERPLTTEDMTNLRVLDCVIKESLRLFPVVPLIPRALSMDIELGPKKLKVPKGASVFVFPYLTHRIPEIYPNPNLFDPSRFLPENSEGRKAYSYIPFGVGPRNCIGSRYATMQLKVLLTFILRKFSVVSASSMAELQHLEPSISLSVKNGFTVNLQNRSF